MRIYFVQPEDTLSDTARALRNECFRRFPGRTNLQVKS